jgi:hypothetical protein
VCGMSRSKCSLYIAFRGLETSDSRNCSVASSKGKSMLSLLQVKPPANMQRNVDVNELSASFVDGFRIVVKLTVTFFFSNRK